MQLQIPVGNMTIVVEANDVKTLWKEGAFWSTLPRFCPRCARERNQQVPLNLTHRNFDGNDYYGLECDQPNRDNNHRTNLGQHKVGGGLFYKEFEKNEFTGQYESTWETWAEIKAKSANKNSGNNGNFQGNNGYDPRPQSQTQGSPQNYPGVQQFATPGFGQQPQQQMQPPPVAYNPPPTQQWAPQPQQQAPPQGWENQVPQGGTPVDPNAKPEPPF